MTDQLTQQDVNNTAWAACDTFRGVIDPAQYKDYILVMLFLKYLSDLWTDLKDEMERKYKGDKQRVERARELLANTNLPIAHLASECGFVSQSYLTTCFRTTYGMTPARFRRTGT